MAAGAWYAHLLLARDEGLATRGYDQAFFQQLVWNLGQGRGFQSSFTPGSFLGLHFEPLLALVAPIELLWADARVLSLLAAAAAAALGPCAFLLLRALTGRAGMAAALAAPLPLWPALQESVRAGFHPEAIGLDLALLAGWAALRERRLLAWVLAALALAGKEDQGWNLLVVGLAVATAPGARRVGMSLAGAGLAWGVAAIGVVMPLLRAGGPLATGGYYSWLLHASPGAVANALVYPRAWLAVLQLILCTGGLALLRPAWLALAVPPLVADLLSAHDPQPALHLQYALPLVAPVLLAAARAAPAVVPAPLWPALALAPVVVGLATGSLPPGISADPAPFSRPPALSRLQACMGNLPKDAPVAADDGLLSRLASRPDLRELGDHRPGDYLVIDRAATQPGYVVIGDRDRVLENALSDSERALLCDDGRFLVIRPHSGREGG